MKMLLHCCIILCYLIFVSGALFPTLKSLLHFSGGETAGYCFGFEILPDFEVSNQIIIIIIITPVPGVFGFRLKNFTCK